jgi:hypothetical protein
LDLEDLNPNLNPDPSPNSLNPNLNPDPSPKLLKSNLDPDPCLNTLNPNLNPDPSPKKKTLFLCLSLNLEVKRKPLHLLQIEIKETEEAINKVKIPIS